MCKVSVIVPVYNTERYLRKCIDSIVNQTYRDLEIILVDDGSTDNSGEICDEYSAKDSRVKVFHIENSGPSKARNTGIKSMTGNYVMFVDSDDWIDDDTVEKVMSAFKKYGGDLLIFEMRNIIGNSKVDCKLFEENVRFFESEQISFLEDILIVPEKYTSSSVLNLTGAVCKVYNKNMIAGCEFPEDMCHAEDYCFIAMVLKKAEKISYIDDVLYNCVVRKDSLSHKTNTSIVESNALIVNWFKSFYEGYKSYEMINELCFRYYSETVCVLQRYETANKKERKVLINEFLKLIGKTEKDFKDVDLECKNRNLKIVWKLVHGKHKILLRLFLKLEQLKNGY